MSTANRLCGQSGNIKYAEAKKRRYSPTLEDGKKEEGLEGMGHLGIFVSNMKGHLCWGAHSALRIHCVLRVFTGDV